MMKVKFLKKRYYDKILRNPGDVVDVDDRAGRAYLNTHSVVLVQGTKSSHSFFSAGRKKSTIPMPTMQDVSNNITKQEDALELEELDDDVVVDVVSKPKRTRNKKPAKVVEDTDEDDDVGFLDSEEINE